MTIRKTSKCFFLFLLLFVTGGTGVVRAQNIDRWAFKTNIIDWAATIPNFSAEFDLTGKENNRMTLGLTARYNWNTHHTTQPYYVFNLWQIRPEYRYYWRPNESKSKHQKRAYYVGAYMDAGKYSLKLSEYGNHGDIYTVGFSLGYGIPKYEYKKGNIDIELGFAIGLALTSDQPYYLNKEQNIYVHDSSNSQGLHIAPFPIVSSLNVSFAWRSKSIKEKYRLTIEDKIRIQEREIGRKRKKEEKQLKKENR